VTHDQIEAMTLGDRIAVLDHGVLQQVGRPDDLFRTPVNVFVAGFIGSPAMNLARGRLVAGADGVELVAGPYRAKLPPRWQARWPGLAVRVGQDVVFGLRPSAFDLSAPDTSEPSIRVAAVTVESLGDERNVLFVPPFAREGIQSEAGEENEPDRLWTARLAPDAPVRFGDTITLVPRLSAAYFFDPETGSAITAANPSPELPSVQPDGAGRVAGTAPTAEPAPTPG
jgi:multiple sugar transport system ATP-binding protein